MLHQIRSLHDSLDGLQNAEAVVVVMFPREDQWLLADDPSALDFFDRPLGIMDQPMPAHELHWCSTVVRDRHVVTEHEPAQHQVRLAVEVDRPYSDSDVAGGRRVFIPGSPMVTLRCPLPSRVPVLVRAIQWEPAVP